MSKNFFSTPSFSLSTKRFLIISLIDLYISLVLETLNSAIIPFDSASINKPLKLFLFISKINYLESNLIKFFNPFFLLFFFEVKIQA